MSYARSYRPGTMVIPRGPRKGVAGLGSLGASSTPSASDLAQLAAAAKTIIGDLKSGSGSGAGGGSSSGGGSAISSTLTSVAQLIQDPALPELACRVGQLYALENRKPVPVCPKLAASSRRGGIGLRKVIPIMRGYVYAEQNPWVKPVAAAAVLGVPFLLGYLVGRK